MSDYLLNGHVLRAYFALEAGESIPLDIVVAGDANFAAAWREETRTGMLERILMHLGRFDDDKRLHASKSGYEPDPKLRRRLWKAYLATKLAPTIAELVAAAERRRA